MTKTFKTLYKKTNTGAIQYWRVWVEEKFNNGNGAGIIHIEYGQQGTLSPQHTQDTILNGKNLGKKNATTAIEQAYLEAEYKFKKQLKKGYKENLNEVSKGDIGEFAQAGISPMLAKKFDDFKTKVKYPALVDIKYNGGRIIATKNGLFTRKGEKYLSIPHIEETLQDFFKKYPDAILDGEGYNHEYKHHLNEIMKLLRKTKHITQEDIKESKNKIKYYIYDGYEFGTITQTSPLKERRKQIEQYLYNLNYIEIVKGKLANNEKELYQIYENYLDNGYEGAMYRDLNSPYENKRSKYLLKIKPEDDDEAIIKDINEGTGDWKETGKIITLEWNGKQFNATFKGSIPQGKQFLKDKNKWIGKKVTFLYNELTGLGTPNFARIDINNCLKE